MANVPVSKEASSAPQEAGMNGLYVTARWELLTDNPTPIPEPYNVDGALRLPTERDAPVNPKYQYDDQFIRTPFSGTTEKMSYMNVMSPRREKGEGFYTVTERTSTSCSAVSSKGRTKRGFLEEARLG